MLRMLYADVYSARFTSSAVTMPNLSTVNSSIAAASGNPIAILFGQYAELRPDAIQQGIISYTGGKLYENYSPSQTVPGGTNSPYTINTVFSAYPRKNSFTDSVTITYNSSLFYTNTSYTVTQVQADFGSGYSTMAPNTSLSHLYTDSTGLHIIKFKVTLSNSQTYYTQMVVHVTLTSSGGSARYAFANLILPDISIAAVPGVHDGCKVYIRRSLSTASNAINKPLIVVEGFDMHDAAPNFSQNYNVNSYITELQETVVQGSFTDLSYHLDNIAHYDLIFIDWNNGTADIRKNAALLEEVILQINTLKAASSSSNQNVVLGISMGGLISRYCLASMTKRNIATGTRLLLTMDSPHEGANVPLAFQHLVRGLQNVTFFGVRMGEVFSNSLDQANNLLNTDGAQQQLVMTVTNASGTVSANTFLNTIYRPMVTFSGSDPVPSYAFKAISNGSQCGVNVMTPGASLVSGSATANLNAVGWLLSSWIGLPVITRWKYHTEVQAKALTGSSSHEIVHFRLKRIQKLFFIINNNKTFASINRNEPSFNTVPWESIPGGYESLGERLSLGSNPLEESWSLIGQWFLGYNAKFSMAPRFGFVPLISSLDVASPVNYNSTYVYPISGLNGSRSDKYIAQERIGTTTLYNSHHTDLTSRNAAWLYHELENLTHNIGCSYVSDCFSSFINVTADQTACDEGVVTASPYATSYTWTTSGNLLINGLSTSLTTTSNSINVTGTEGNVAVTASYTCGVTAFGNIDYFPFRRVIDNIYPEYLNNDHISVTVNTTAYDNYYRWYINDNLVKEGSYASYYCTCYYEGPTGIFCGDGNKIRVEVDTDCETTISEEINFHWICGFRMANVDIYPNPARDLVNIRIKDDVGLVSDKSKIKLSGIKQVIIYDKLGGVKKIASFKTEKNIQLNVSNLPADIYFIEISDGINKTRSQLSINK